MGTKEEFGKLALAANENFCMGGPGIILSRETLSRFTPHIKKCLKNFYTFHEDVELGRCVHKFANTSCTWTYEMQHILYNHPNKTEGYKARNLVSTDILRAVSLHSIKDIRVFTRVHNFALQRRIMELEQRKMVLKRQIDLNNQLLSIRNQLKIQTRNLSKMIQITKNEGMKSKLKQIQKVFNQPDQYLAEQMLAIHNTSYRLFHTDKNHQFTTGMNQLFRWNHLCSLLEQQLWRVVEDFFHRSHLTSNDFVSKVNSTLKETPLEPGIYTLFTASQYSANTELPVRSIEPAYRQCFDEVVRTYMEEVNKISRTMGRFLEYKKTLYGYYKYEPKYGMNYILDLYLIYRKYLGKKMSVREYF